MEDLQWLLLNYGHHIATILLVVFLGALPLRDKLPGRIVLFVIGAGFLLTVWIGLRLSLRAY